MMERRTISMNRAVLIVAAVLLAAGAWLVLSGNRADTIQPSSAARPGSPAAHDLSELETAPVQGAVAPDFTLVDLEGENVQLAELRGRPVVINFWATWCAPCRLEMPAIQSRSKAFDEQGLVVLAVNFDESEEPVAAFRDELGLTFPILLDPGARVQNLYRNRSYPTTFFLDENGVIQVQHIGVMTEGQLDDNLARIGLGS